MPGVTRQVIGVHSGNLVTNPQMMSVDNRDSNPNDPTEMPHEFICTELVHFTENEFARSIGLLGTDQSFSFRPSPWYDSWRARSENRPLQLTWWSPRPPDNWIDAVTVRDYNIGSSPCINGESLCGPVGFVVKWKDILEQYAKGRQGEIKDIEFRNLGTYLYRKEIMFAVMVCMTK